MSSYRIFNTFEKVSSSGVPYTQIVNRVDIASGGSLRFTTAADYLSIGTSSSTYGSGLKLTSSKTSVLRAYADDGAAVIGDAAVRSGVFRFLNTVSQTGETSMFGAQAQFKIKAPLDNTLTSGNRAGSWNYCEIAGTTSKTVTLSGPAKFTGGCFGMADWDGVGTLVISSGHVFGGFGALTNVTKTGGTFTRTGTFAGFATLNNGASSYYPFDYGLYMPADSVVAGILIGASSSDPIVYAGTGTLNMVEVNSKLTAASGTLRGIVSYAEFSGTHVSTTMNCYAIRGYAKVSGTVGAGNTNYSTGIQGKLELSGTIGGGKHCAVLAQLNSSAGLAGATGGTVYCLWADGMQVSQTPASALNMTAIGVELPDAATRFDSVFYVYGGATYLFDVQGESVGGSYAATYSTAPAAATGTLKCRVGSTDVYLLVTTDPTA
jgi:hypothetical protein